MKPATILVYVGDMALNAFGPKEWGDKKYDKVGNKTLKTPGGAGCADVVYDEIVAFVDWMETLKQYDVKIIVPGNHDMCLDPNKAQPSIVADLEDRLKRAGITYLGGGRN